MNAEIMAAHAWPTNGHLIRDVARLGYLRADWRTLDPTYGKGTFWKQWRPTDLVTHDLAIDGVDFTALPYEPYSFSAVVFDPPYKLNGTATESVDARYGVGGEYQSIKQRHQLIVAGFRECYRVLSTRGFLLVKCQDQVSGGRVRWQSRLIANYAEQRRTWDGCKLDLVDQFMMLGHRAQPPGRSQVHARRNYSTLLVFEKRLKR